jgi:hypothetical protein
VKGRVPSSLGTSEIQDPEIWYMKNNLKMEINTDKCKHCKPKRCELEVALRKYLFHVKHIAYID